jgi:hypothetical protein
MLHCGRQQALITQTKGAAKDRKKGVKIRMAAKKAQNIQKRNDLFLRFLRLFAAIPFLFFFCGPLRLPVFFFSYPPSPQAAGRRLSRSG